MKKGIVSGLLVIGLVLGAIAPVTAKGVLNRITIKQQGREWTVNDRRVLWFLSPGQLENFQEGGWRDAPPNAVTAGYELEREYINPADGTYQIFDRVRYHPNTHSGRGYIYVYELDYDPGNYSDKWYPITPEGEVALQAVFTGENMKCPITQARDVSGIDAPAAGTNTIAFSAIAVAQPVNDGEPYTVSGTLYVHDSVPGEFVLGGTWLDGDEPVEFASRAWATHTGRSEWVDHLNAKDGSPDENGYAVYDWQARFPASGCYVLYVYADFQSAQVFIELE